MGWIIDKWAQMRWTGLQHQEGLTLHTRWAKAVQARDSSVSALMRMGMGTRRRWGIPAAALAHSYRCLEKKMSPHKMEGRSVYKKTHPSRKWDIGKKKKYDQRKFWSPSLLHVCLFIIPKLKNMRRCICNSPCLCNLCLQHSKLLFSNDVSTCGCTSFHSWYRSFSFPFVDRAEKMCSLCSFLFHQRLLLGTKTAIVWWGWFALALKSRRKSMATLLLFQNWSLCIHFS